MSSLKSFFSSSLYIKNIEMGPGPTRGYFWATKIRGRPVFDTGTFWPNLKRLFWPKGKKLKNLGFLVEIFQTQTRTKDGWHDPTWVKNFCPGHITIKILLHVNYHITDESLHMGTYIFQPKIVPFLFIWLEMGLGQNFLTQVRSGNILAARLKPGGVSLHLVQKICFDLPRGDFQSDFAILKIEKVYFCH